LFDVIARLGWVKFKFTAIFAARQLNFFAAAKNQVAEIKFIKFQVSKIKFFKLDPANSAGKPAPSQAPLNVQLFRLRAADSIAGLIGANLTGFEIPLFKKVRFFRKRP